MSNAIDHEKPHSTIVSFQDGRECVTQDIIDRSSLLKSVLETAAAAPSKEKASVDLSRASFQFWVQSAVRPSAAQTYLSDSNLVKLIQVRARCVVPLWCPLWLSCFCCHCSTAPYSSATHSVVFEGYLR